MSPGKFPFGQLVMTGGVNNEVAQSSNFARFVMDSLRRHAAGDWGDMGADDEAANDEALREGGLRIFSAYEHDGLAKIWIITEADRSTTTVLFPDEY